MNTYFFFALETCNDDTVLYTKKNLLGCVKITTFLLSFRSLFYICTKALFVTLGSAHISPLSHGNR